MLICAGDVVAGARRGSLSGASLGTMVGFELARRGVRTAAQPPPPPARRAKASGRCLSYRTALGIMRDEVTDICALERHKPTPLGYAAWVPGRGW